MKIVKTRSMTLGNGRPKICVPVMGKSKDELRSSAAGLKDVPYDFVEWRSDLFEGMENPKTIFRCLEILRDTLGDKPLLFTCRTRREGGEGELSSSEYYSINREVAEKGLCDLVDIELSSGSEDEVRSQVEYIRKNGALVVLSSHDFDQTPSRQEITDRFLKMQELGGDISKIAVMPQREEDVLTLLFAALDMKNKLADRPYAAISMGKLGALSRGAAGFAGSAFTFGAAADISAPGQFSARDLKRMIDLLD